MKLKRKAPPPAPRANTPNGQTPPALDGWLRGGRERRYEGRRSGGSSALPPKRHVHVSASAPVTSQGISCLCVSGLNSGGSAVLWSRDRVARARPPAPPLQAGVLGGRVTLGASFGTCAWERQRDLPVGSWVPSERSHARCCATCRCDICILSATAEDANVRWMSYDFTLRPKPEKKKAL